MRADGLLAMLDRWGRAALPGAVLLFFVLLTLAPLRAPYLSDALPLLPVLVVFQFSLAMPERLPGPLLLVMGAEMTTPQAVNFMAIHGRGLICVAMTDERLKELEVGSMVPANSALGGTAFTVSIDLKRQDITTGISAYDRAQTIKMAVNPNSHPEDFARPGHVFPLCARPGGVLERRGQTEAAVDLASLAGLQPAGVICEIINDDGTMARLPDLIGFCKKHDLLMITVADLARYRFDCDYEGSLAACDGMFPVCNTISPTELDRTYATETPYINAELIG